MGDHEYPLVLRVNLGPHEDIAKLYIFDKNQTTEINHEVKFMISLKSRSISSVRITPDVLKN